MFSFFATSASLPIIGVSRWPFSVGVISINLLSTPGTLLFSSSSSSVSSPPNL